MIQNRIYKFASCQTLNTNVFAIRFVHAPHHPTHKYAYIMLNLKTISGRQKPKCGAHRMCCAVIRSQHVRTYCKRHYIPTLARAPWCTSMNDSIMTLWRIIQIFLGLGTDSHSLHILNPSSHWPGHCMCVYIYNRR